MWSAENQLHHSTLNTRNFPSTDTDVNIFLPPVNNLISDNQRQDVSLEVSVCEQEADRISQIWEGGVV